MTLVPANDLIAMKATQILGLPSSCTIERANLSPDGAGGWTGAWATLASGVACRLAPVGNPSEVIVADRYTGKALWQLTLPSGQDITHADRVVLSGLTYEVVGIQSGGAWATATRVLLVRLE